MTELNPAQRLRVAAALTGVTNRVQVTREDALALAQGWERADQALNAMEAATKAREARIQQMEDWAIRIVIGTGAAQAIVASALLWWLT